VFRDDGMGRPVWEEMKMKTGKNSPEESSTVVASPEVLSFSLYKLILACVKRGMFFGHS